MNLIGPKRFLPKNYRSDRMGKVSSFGVQWFDTALDWLDTALDWRATSLQEIQSRVESPHSKRDSGLDGKAKSRTIEFSSFLVRVPWVRSKKTQPNGVER
jgi:hypothetical protein